MDGQKENYEEDIGNESNIKKTHFLFICKSFLMSSYELVIGLEIHLKLNSATKLFCGCSNVQEFDDLAPNTHICPICSGQPGALPVLQQ